MGHSIKPFELSEADIAKFWSAFERGPPDQCWDWPTVSKNPRRAYGSFRLIGGRDRQAHRVSYQIANGPIPDGLVIRHTCDNKPCVNPAHLVVGTVYENNWDRFRQHGFQRSQGENNHKAKLTAEQVITIRRLRSDGILIGELADQYGVAKSTIDHIVSGRRWAHLLNAEV